MALLAEILIGEVRMVNSRAPRRRAVVKVACRTVSSRRCVRECPDVGAQVACVAVGIALPAEACGRVVPGTGTVHITPVNQRIFTVKTGGDSVARIAEPGRPCMREVRDRSGP